MNQNTPFISICIPVYNMYGTIRRTVESALAQNYSSFEVLVLDNQSTDGTFEEASSMQDLRLRVVRNESNLGAYGNHNRALELARGDWVKFLHGDDELLPNCLEIFALYLEEAHLKPSICNELALIACGGIQYSLDNKEESRTFLPQSTVVMHSAPVSEFGRAGNIIGTPSMVMIHRERLISIGGFDVDMTPIADGDCWINLRNHFPSMIIPHHLVILRDDPWEGLSRKACQISSFCKKDIAQIIKWYEKDVRFRSYAFRDTPYFEWLNFEMVRYWNVGIKFALLGRISPIATLVKELKVRRALLDNVVFFLMKRLMFRVGKRVHADPWPVALSHLIEVDLNQPPLKAHSSFHSTELSGKVAC